MILKRRFHNAFFIGFIHIFCYIKSMQKDIFLNTPKNIVSIEDMANRTQVSVATIRNWIKTGYLSPYRQGYVTEESVQHFLQNDFKHRLHRRANKSQKDFHNRLHIQTKFLDHIQNQSDNLDILGDTYEKTLSDSYRNKEGIYYTPHDIVHDVFTPNKKIANNSTFCDPCCGSGNFVIRAFELGFKPQNIYAFDTDPVAIAITQKRLLNKSNYNSPNIIQQDFLQVASTQPFAFDFMFTNPPWGKKYHKTQRDFYGKIFNAGNSLDTCALFYFACLQSLKTGGEMGLLLPESFFNIASFEDARKSVMQYAISDFKHYGKAFIGLLTNVCAFTMQKKQTSNNFIKCTVQEGVFKRKKHHFINNPKSIFNIKCTNADAQVLDYVFHIPHITLEKNADWALGIVTGNNKKFIQDHMRDGYIPVHKGSDISNANIKKASHFIPADLSLYQQVASMDLYQSPKKLIYKFISSKLNFYYDTQQRYILNSANMLIPHTDFPISGDVLADVLSSNFVNWIFKNIFDTHKILRKDLESLPLHVRALQDTEFFDEQEYINALGLEHIDGTYRIKK